MNNEHTITGDDVATLAATDLLRKRKKYIRGADKKPKNVFSLHATDAQVQSDNRLIVITRFLAVAHAKRKGTRSSEIRDFFIEAMYSAIVSKAEKAKANKKAVAAIEGGLEKNNNIALDA